MDQRESIKVGSRVVPLAFKYINKLDTKRKPCRKGNIKVTYWRMHKISLKAWDSIQPQVETESD